MSTGLTSSTSVLTSNALSYTFVDSGVANGTLQLMPTVYTNYQYQTPGGTEFKLGTKTDGISPNLLFKFVRSKFKMNEYQEKKHKARLSKLGKLVQEAKELNQRVMYEELSRILAIAVRESEMMSYGINRWVERKFIDQFMDKVKDRTVFFKDLSEFPRPIPGNVRARIKVLTEHEVFDELWILYIDYTKQNLKTTEKKIREKDPVLFGRLKYNPDVFYYITDWVDEFCDLTLDSVVEKMKASDTVYQVQDIPEMDEKYFEVIKKEVLDRTNRLNSTGVGNYRDLAAQEAQKAKETPAWKKQVSWFKKLKWWGKA